MKTEEDQAGVEGYPLKTNFITGLGERRGEKTYT